jgi:hypothetical protein
MVFSCETNPFEGVSRSAILLWIHLVVDYIAAATRALSKGISWSCMLVTVQF